MEEKEDNVTSIPTLLGTSTATIEVVYVTFRSENSKWQGGYSIGKGNIEHKGEVRVTSLQDKPYKK